MTTELNSINGCKVDLAAIFGGNRQKHLAETFLVCIIFNKKVCKRKSRFHISGICFRTNLPHKRNCCLFSPSLKRSLFKFSSIYSLAFIKFFVHGDTGHRDTLFLSESCIVCSAENEFVAL